MNTDIFNYLGFYSEKLANLYKSGRFNPLPADFILSENQIKERLIFSQIEPNLPKFVFDEKKKIKNYFKISQKNIKNSLKFIKKSEDNHIFLKKVNFYLILRLKLTNIFLKEFKNQDFNELASLEQIFRLDPVFFEILGDMFDDNFEITQNFDELSKSYDDYYLKITKFFEKKNNSKKKKSVKEVENLALLEHQRTKTKRPVEKIAVSQKTKNTQNKTENLKKDEKNSTKTTKNTKNKEI